MVPMRVARDTNPFAPGKAPTQTMCPRGGVWCGRIPTAVLAFQCNSGMEPTCRGCGTLYKPPQPPPQPANGSFGTRPNRWGGEGKGSGKGSGEPKPKTVLEKENERLKELLKTSGVKDPEESKKNEEQEDEIEKLEKGIQVMQGLGLDAKPLQEKLAKTKAAKGQHASKPQIYAKLMAAQNTLKQVLENHEKMHKALAENFEKGAKQASVVQLLQKQYDEILYKEGYSKPQEGQGRVNIVSMPANLDEGQKLQWNAVVQGEADERNLLESQRGEELKKKLETLTEIFGKQVRVEPGPAQASVPHVPPPNGPNGPPAPTIEQKPSEAKEDEEMGDPPEKDDDKKEDMLDDEFASQLEQVDEATGKRIGMEGAQAFQRLAKAQRKGNRSDKNKETPS